MVFFSPSGVRSFAKFNSLEKLKIFSIGQTTEKELKKFTQNRIFTSKESNLEDLLSVIRCQVVKIIYLHNERKANNQQPKNTD